MFRGAAALIVVTTAFASGVAFAADGQRAPTAPQPPIPNAPASAVWFEGRTTSPPSCAGSIPGRR